MSDNSHDAKTKLLNGLRAAGIAAAAVTSAAAALYYYLVRRPLAQVEGELRLAGLRAPVQVLRDHWGVPHIYADNEFDLFFAQGYVHAQDRLWQMEFNRRVVAGRMSELVGSVTVDFDRWMRTLGLYRAAEAELDHIDRRTLRDLQAYAAGVNARIDQGRLPMEFSLLMHQPEPWSVVDSLGWIKMMSWSLSGNWESELMRAKLIDKLGPELTAELDYSIPDRWPYIVPEGVDYGAIGDSAVRRAEDARKYTGPDYASGLGSNNWAVSGKRTASGLPLFANDMHLPMDLPSIWYENHLVAGDLNVTGVSFAGLPGIISGHNGRVAWGYTNGFSDVQDLYMERIRRTEDGKVQAEYLGVWEDAEVRKEEIWVRGQDPVIEEVIVTRHGPLINSVAKEEQPLALRFTALEPEGMVNALHPMIRASNCVELREALRYWTSPTQNVVYADVDGNIGFTHAGKIPIRAKGDGKLPVPGWDGEHEWTGWIPFDELPTLYNPEEGFIVTANNPVVDERYPHNLGLDHATGDRAQRIREMIEAGGEIDAAAIKQMQSDVHSAKAVAIKGFIGALQLDDPELARLVEMVREWDGELTAESAAAAIYQQFVRQMLTIILRPRLGELTNRYTGKGSIPGLADGSLFGLTAWVWLEKTLADPDSHWFDLGGGEKRDQVMAMALRQAGDFLQEAMGPDPEAWSWGGIHTLTFSHVLGRATTMGQPLNKGPYPLAGDGSTVAAGLETSYEDGSGVVIGPPFRFIADLADLGRSLGCLVPGQSGQPSSEHYGDQIHDWQNGRYHQMLYRRQDVERALEHRLKLYPA